MDSYPYFLTPKGEMVRYDDICSHIGIAVHYLETNPELQEEFKQSGIRYATDFLVQRKGYIQVTDEEGNGYYNKKIVFSACKMTPYQKGVIMQYLADGFEPDNVDRASNSIVKRFHDFEK